MDRFPQLSLIGKKLRQLLDITAQKCYNEYEKRRRTLHKPERNCIMKKVTIETLVAYLNGETVTNLDEIKAELEAELTKGKAKADANRAIYEDIHDAVIKVLESATNPVTAQELADETGYAKGKIVYGLRNYWANEVEKTEGKVNTYALKG